MKRKRFTEEQIILILKEREAGMKVAELRRKNGGYRSSRSGTCQRH